MKRKFLPVGAVVAVLLSGLVHGAWTGRWADDKDVSVPAARLPHLALTLGDWQGTDMEFDTRPVGPVAGYLYRRYVNQRTGAVATLSLAAGRPGPVSIHTPDVCYVASGFAAASKTRFAPTLAPSVPSPELWTAQFIRTNATEQKHLRVIWSWQAGGKWMVSETPRLAFARYPVLFKLHLVREMAHADEPLEDDPCVDLLRLLLPEFQKTVFPAS